MNWKLFAAAFALKFFVEKCQASESNELIENLGIEVGDDKNAIDPFSLPLVLFSLNGSENEILTKKHSDSAEVFDQIINDLSQSPQFPSMDLKRIIPRFGGGLPKALLAVDVDVLDHFSEFFAQHGMKIRVFISEVDGKIQGVEISKNDFFIIQKVLKWITGSANQPEQAKENNSVANFEFSKSLLDPKTMENFVGFVRMKSAGEMFILAISLVRICLSLFHKMPRHSENIMKAPQPIELDAASDTEVADFDSLEMYLFRTSDHFLIKKNPSLIMTMAICAAGKTNSRQVLSFNFDNSNALLDLLEGNGIDLESMDESFQAKNLIVLDLLENLSFEQIGLFILGDRSAFDKILLRVDDFAPRPAFTLQPVENENQLQKTNIFGFEYDIKKHNQNDGVSDGDDAESIEETMEEAELSEEEMEEVMPSPEGNDKQKENAAADTEESEVELKSVKPASNSDPKIDQNNENNISSNESKKEVIENDSSKNSSKSKTPKKDNKSGSQPNHQVDNKQSQSTDEPQKKVNQAQSSPQGSVAAGSNDSNDNPRSSDSDDVSDFDETKQKSFNWTTAVIGSGVLLIACAVGYIVFKLFILNRSNDIHQSTDL